MPKINIIGSMKDLNENGQYESFVPYNDLINKLESMDYPDFISLEIEVDGASPTLNSLTKSTDRNGYKSKQLSFNREFVINTRRLFNHNTSDVALMRHFDYLHTFSYHYFTFWGYEYDKNTDAQILINRHKSVFGDLYFNDLVNHFQSVPGFIVCTFESPGIKNNYADINSKHSANRVYSWNVREYGIRSIKDILGG